MYRTCYNAVNTYPCTSLEVRETIPPHRYDQTFQTRSDDQLCSVPKTWTLRTCTCKNIRILYLTIIQRLIAFSIYLTRWPHHSWSTNSFLLVGEVTISLPHSPHPVHMCRRANGGLCPILPCIINLCCWAFSMQIAVRFLSIHQKGVLASCNQREPMRTIRLLFHRHWCKEHYCAYENWEFKADLQTVTRSTCTQSSTGAGR